MTNFYNSTKRSVRVIACLSLAVLMAACANSNGYYDSNGNYRLYPSSHQARADKVYHKDQTTGNDNPYSPADDYDRRGYYNRQGNYVGASKGLNIPENMIPPRGMCRVWLTQRDLSAQPKIESCDDIKSRVPAGAYVIYGG